MKLVLPLVAALHCIVAAAIAVNKNTDNFMRI